MSKKSTDVRTTRYSAGGTTEQLLSGRLGWWERTIFPPERDDITGIITADLAGRPDLLSYKAYGSPKFAWLILQYNNILDINTEFVEGARYTIPSARRVLFEFS